MLLGDINYNLSLGYVLTFLLATMAVMSMLHAFRNLAHLEIRAGHADAVFSGGTARFVLHFHNRNKLPRYRLILRDDQGNTVSFDVPKQQDSEVVFPMPAKRRGWLPLGNLTLYTEFPLGLFHAWSYLHFDARCLVYPKPLADAPLPPGDARTTRADAAAPGTTTSAGCATTWRATPCRASPGKPLRASRLAGQAVFRAGRRRVVAGHGRRARPQQRRQTSAHDALGAGCRSTRVALRAASAGWRIACKQRRGTA